MYKKIGVGIGVIVLIALTALFLVMKSQTLKNGMRFKDRKVSDSVIKMIIPQFEDKEIINARIEELAEKYRREFAYQRGEQVRDFKDSFDFRYSVPGATKKYLSLKFSMLVYYSGAAHPQHWLDTLTFDLASQKVIKLPELFKPGSDYIKVLSRTCIRELKQRGLEEKWVEQGAGPEAENFNYFNLSDKALIITFPEYQVAPYAAGEQVVEIPLKELPLSIP